MKVSLGYRKDPVDTRDRKFGDDLRARLGRRVAYGDEYRIPLHRLPRNQTGNSCTSNAWMRAVEILSDLEASPLPDLSAQGHYWCERQRVGETDRDDGAYLRTGGEVLTKIGVAPATTWPDNATTLFEQPDPSFFVNAEDGKITGYYRIDASDPLDDIETAIRANHPVIFGADVGQEFVSWDGIDESKVFDAPASALGGHAMVCVGVRGVGDARAGLVLTSWGAFGLQGMGLAWFSAAYMRTASDLWVATRGGPG